MFTVDVIAKNLDQFEVGADINIRHDNPGAPNTTVEAIGSIAASDWKIN